MNIVGSDTGAEVAQGQEGELLIRGPQIMKGYLNRPQDTADSIDPAGWYHTGDVGYVDAEGWFFIVDREDPAPRAGGDAEEARSVLTYAEYETLPDDGRRYEIHEGEPSVMPVHCFGQRPTAPALAFRRRRELPGAQNYR